MWILNRALQHLRRGGKMTPLTFLVSGNRRQRIGGRLQCDKLAPLGPSVLHALMQSIFDPPSLKLNASWLLNCHAHMKWM